MTNLNVPFIGSNGNWYIEGEDTGMKAQGDAGHQGPVVPQGEMDPTGITGRHRRDGICGSSGT